MSRQIEQALLSMMPTLGSDLSTSLIQLSSSLLAQSRNVASALKPEEEVARLYACANIACDRLRISLDLPSIEPRPPIPPRIYKKLYSHLDQSLPNPVSTPSRRTVDGTVRTPGSRSRPRQSSATQVSPSKGRATPTKAETLAAFQKSDKSAQIIHQVTSSQQSAFPAWIRPVSRYLCTELGHKNLGPTVIAGMEYVVAPGGRRSRDESINDNMCGLLAGIYYFTILRASSMDAGYVEQSKYVAERKEILATLKDARTKVLIKGIEEDIAWDGWQALKNRDFDVAIGLINTNNWLSADWYRGIQDVLGQPSQGDALGDDEDDQVLPIQTRRADTMFQEKYNYLSEARQDDYKAWKDKILIRIDNLERSSDNMEVDS